MTASYQTRALSRLGAGLLGMLVISASWAQSLDDTLQQALQYQSELRTAQLQVVEQQAVLQNAQAQTGFQLRAQGEAGIGYFGTSAAFPESGRRYPLSVALIGSYPIYTAGRERIAIEAAQSGVEAAQANVEAQKSRIALEVVSLYAAIRNDELTLQLSQDNQKALDRAASDAAKRLKAGEVTKTDLAQAQAQQAQGLAQQAQARAAILVNQARLRQYTGQPFVGTSQRLQAPPVPSLDESLGRMANSSPIQAARKQLEAARKQVELARAGLKPTVALAGQIAHQEGSDFLTNPVNVSNIKLQAEIPIWDNGRNRAEVARARAAEQLAIERVSGLIQQFDAQLRQQYANLEAARLQRPALEQSVAAAQLAYQTIQRELELGTRTTYDLLTAQQALQNARTQVILNEQQQALAAYQILATNGMLEPRLR